MCSVRVIGTATYQLKTLRNRVLQTGGLTSEAVISSHVFAQALNRLHRGVTNYDTGTIFGAGAEY